MTFYFLFLASVQSNETVDIFIKGKDNRKFRGFLIQALDDDGNIVGTFSFDASQRAKCLECNNPCDSITHKNAAMKSKVVATWTPPSDFTGTISFRYTIVLSYSEYWVAIDGPTVNVL